MGRLDSDSLERFITWDYDIHRLKYRRVYKGILSLCDTYYIRHQSLYEMLIQIEWISSFIFVWIQFQSIDLYRWNGRNFVLEYRRILIFYVGFNYTEFLSFSFKVKGNCNFKWNLFFLGWEGNLAILNWIYFFYIFGRLFWIVWRINW